MVLPCSNLLKLARTIIVTVHGRLYDKVVRIQMWFRDPREGRAAGPPQGLSPEPGSSSLCIIPPSASKPLCSPGCGRPTCLGSSLASKRCLKSLPLRPKAEFPGQRAQVALWVRLPSLGQSTVGRICGDRPCGVTSSRTPPLWL